MPTAPVDQNGTVLYFEDSGAPSSSDDYTTVMILHGAIFHCGTFRPVFPYASRNNLRIVLINWRDYPESTPYSDAELERMRGPLDAQAAALAAHGVEFQNFIVWFVKTHQTPPIKANKDGSLSGGVAFAAWSAGNLQCIALLAHADKASTKTRALLDIHLRTLIVYSPNHTAIGAPAHPKLYSPFRDGTLSPAQKEAAFLPWICAYYTGVDLASDGAASEKAILAREKLDIKPTHERMTPEELAGILDTREKPQTAVPLEFLNPLAFQDVVRRGLFDCASAGAPQPVWPRVRVRVVWPAMDVDDVLWTAELLRRQAEDAKKSANIGREVDVVRIDDMNHFGHWDAPEKFVEFLANVV
ncbi:uncharacterized protein FIBRA_07773 [Fibroporia radiculosa]|uniref:Uncharacterized protein n=1 Tax=Fibroporia radiculosa TaxID=599839 RepID=J4IC00_9APHY|nr:uncharacterized protein FIBRA_07773 [Fibroporia radiculosa]CCM05546.1 predicted protein [Fibroporia radiculosa]